MRAGVIPPTIQLLSTGSVPEQQEAAKILWRLSLLGTSDNVSPVTFVSMFLSLPLKCLTARWLLGPSTFIFC